MPLRETLLPLLLCVALAGCGEVAKEAPPPAPASAEPSMYRSLAKSGANVDVAAARDMISLYRQNNGLQAVSLDPKLQQAAQAEADAMARAGSLDARARGSLQKRLAAAGVTGAEAVENVSAGYHTLAEAFSGWRQSAPHNRKMLAAEATRMGLATAYAPGKKYKVYWALILSE